MTNVKTDLVGVFKRKIEKLSEKIRVLETEAAERKERFRDEQELRNQLDEEVILLIRKIEVLENDFEETEKRLQEAKLKWNEMNATAEECERARKQLQNHHETDDERIYQLELLVKEATGQASETEARYEEVSRKLMAAENMLENLEDEHEKTDKQLREVSSEFNIVCNSFKILEQNELKSAEKEKAYDTESQRLKKQLQEAERRAQLAETELTQRQMMLDQLEDAFDTEKRNHMLLQNDMQRMVDEFQQM